MTEKQIKKNSTWKVAGPIEVQDYWFKSMKSRPIQEALINDTL